MSKISVVINTYNASEHLQEVLETVKDFDEVLICDMESTDNTLEIARKYGCNIVTFPKGNHKIVEPARNFAIQSAKHEWVLVVDADEIVTPELKKYLEKCANEGNVSGLYIPRKNKYLGEYLPRFTCDHQLRFFKKKGTDWPTTIHSIPHVSGTVEYIPKNNDNLQLLHLADDTISQAVNKMNRYTDYDMEKKAHKHYGALALFYRPLWRFMRSYFLQGDFRCGGRGLIHAGMVAVYQFIFVAKMLEARYKQNSKKF